MEQDLKTVEELTVERTQVVLYAAT
jgi:hypothetical protein